MDMWFVFYWTGPVGIGAFLTGLGVLFWGISKLQKGKKEK
jgi:hypothetical protein